MMMSGKPAVNRRDWELCCAGAATLDESTAAFVFAELEGTEFADPLIRKLFKALRELHSQGLPCADPNFLCDRMIADGVPVDDAAIITAECLEQPHHWQLAPFYAAKLKALHRRDRARTALERGQQKLKDPTAETDEVLSSIVRNLENIQAGSVETGLIDARTALAEWDSRSTVPAIPLGLASLDRQLRGGVRPGQLIVIGGRPGTGKSAMLLQVVASAAAAGTPAVFGSLEMSAGELAGRGVKSIPRERFASLSLWFSEATSLQKLIEQIRLAVRRDRVRIAGVDYLQLCEEPRERGTSRAEQVAGMSRSLKLLARELQIPILLGSQLNRESLKKDRPGLADLRESGGIEQDADIVILLHSPADSEDVREALVAKHRGGPCGLVRLSFEGERFEFRELADSFAEGWRL